MWPGGWGWTTKEHWGRCPRAWKPRLPAWCGRWCRVGMARNGDRWRAQGEGRYGSFFREKMGQCTHRRWGDRKGQGFCSCGFHSGSNVIGCTAEEIGESWLARVKSTVFRRPFFNLRSFRYSGRDDQRRKTNKSHWPTRFSGGPGRWTDPKEGRSCSEGKWTRFNTRADPRKPRRNQGFGKGNP